MSNETKVSGPVDVLAGERDARTIYDIACIREEKHGASREDLEFKAIALRNYQFCAAVAELIEADREYDAAVYALYRTKGVEEAHVAHRKLADAKARRSAALASFGGAK